MRIAILHPDLGIGGAERLIVDAAYSLQSRGHTVDIFTSYHDPNHAFNETKDGTLRVHVLGDWFPRTLWGYLHIVCAIIRQIHLAIMLAISISLSKIIAPSLAFHAWHRPTQRYDVILVDQLSAAIPLLRVWLGIPVVFYCHFPDKLLASGSVAPVSGDGKIVYPARMSKLKQLYRIPMDLYEEFSTADADALIANSEFTSNVIQNTFREVEQTPIVIYPSVDTSDLVGSAGELQSRIFLSINRFEPKKNATLAVEAYAKLVEGLEQSERDSLALVLAGGYDARLPSNVDCVQNLETLCKNHSLSYEFIDDTQSISSKQSKDVYFMLNINTQTKKTLLNSPSTLALLYTPTNEHFGIVPVEAMACGKLVLATNTGGPVESIKDGETGYLLTSDPFKWSQRMKILLLPSNQEKIIASCKARVDELFTLHKAGEKFEQVLGGVVGHGLSNHGERGMLIQGTVFMFLAMTFIIYIVGFY
ncbi:UDP-Glycosyltransferase/glycogen phosphorylase [Wallemia mellicola]|uniref:Alpha-1,3/1,6-mannosyltransferase ALG2 n=1 Tax=Wallemia mellicola TaxID=1708541 RepID=A0A4T0SZL2_9BASI|nr:UDP-Glycosyltransferase/glycogen phosphorylase [Wallemia mellicola]TIC57360.1 UDP-Glycosyltransferase/glycogen phosphorylase [Wallemia mellicola]